MLKPTVVLVDHQQTYRDAFALALGHSGELVVCERANDAKSALALALDLKPTLLVTSLFLPDGDGIALVCELRRRRHVGAVAILAPRAHVPFARDAFRAGVSGFLFKEQPLVEIVAALTSVAVGRRTRVAAPGLEAAWEHCGLPSLTSRQRAVLLLLAAGHSSKDIARRLMVSARTVDAHRMKIHRKLGTRTPAALTRYAVDRTLVGTV